MLKIIPYSIVIPAAGQGKRMQANRNKQFITLDDKPVIVHTLLAFQNDRQCTQIILVVNERERAEFRRLINRYELTKVTELINGGRERQDSVFAGLKQIDADEDDIVLIHDGARPFVSVDMIHRVTNKAAESGAAILAVPVVDTIKRVEANHVMTTVDRSSLWAVQTPQAFRLSIIKRAHEHADHLQKYMTDDASLVEWEGHSVSVVLGEEYNIKLTTPYDLIVASVILERIKGEGSS